MSFHDSQSEPLFAISDSEGSCIQTTHNENQQETIITNNNNNNNNSHSHINDHDDANSDDDSGSSGNNNDDSDNDDNNDNNINSATIGIDLPEYFKSQEFKKKPALGVIQRLFEERIDQPSCLQNWKQ
ncbi:unnamed protein product [Ambrosiozyma monospora]|uniref:Unnamed protein product n=1 Tax=Ambrosiozyma monospora TaxID=43982 RepID=A0A9W6WL69_AMBMO|nr:unnamed protein product [Ambrosiozyma monospora]